MNAVEFVFALIAVFGSTAAIYLWNRFVYSLDDRYGTWADRSPKPEPIESSSADAVNPTYPK